MIYHFPKSQHSFHTVSFGFRPSMEKVMKRMIFGAKRKGFQVVFCAGQSLQECTILLNATNYRLAWSKENPVVKRNLLERNLNEKTAFNTADELDHFIRDEIPRHKQDFLEAKEAVLKRIEQTKINLNLDALEHKHKEIQRTGSESFLELTQKCEQGRAEMKNYQYETSILRIIAYTYDPLEGYSPEEFVVHSVIQSSENQNIPESIAREILLSLGLPEDHIITIKKYGFGTQFKLAKTNEEKTKL
jgi:hypothetical protein